MNEPAHILSFGKNPLLLQTRGTVLAKKFLVSTVSSVEGLPQLGTFGPFDLAVFCHTLSEAECCSAAEICRTRWPGAKILALTSDEEPCAPAHPDATVSALDGPVALLKTVAATLNAPAASPQHC